MTKVETSIDIRAPLAEVFAYASDYRKWEDLKKYLENLKIHFEKRGDAP